jgi:hypothetical protein
MTGGQEYVCDNCRHLRVCHCYLLERIEGASDSVKITCKTNDEFFAKLCGRRCAKRYARHQFVFLRLQGKI